MSITRRLPNSDETRERALNLAKNKKDNPGLDGNFLTTATNDRVDVIQPDFSEAMAERGAGLTGQTGATATLVTAKTNAARFLSHFIQVFNLGVARGVYPASHRGYYQLDVNSDAVPPLGTEQEITQMGVHIATGDGLRVGAGGAAMSNPTAAQVATAVGDFNTANTAQSVLKDAYDALQEAVEDLREEADAVIKRVWNEVETFYDDEDAPSKRRKAREWGVVYVSDQAITFHLSATDNATTLPLEGVQIELEETGNTVLTDAAGNAELVTHLVAEECTLRFTKAGYVEALVQVTLGTDVDFTLSQAMVHV